MRQILVPIVISLLLLCSAASAQYESSSSDNTWIWTPASGNPHHYIVQKTTDSGDTWETLADAPSEPVEVFIRMNTDGEETLADGTSESGKVISKIVIRHVIESTVDENYQLRVRAASADNNYRGPWSPISEEIKVRLQPGTPTFIRSG